MKKIPQRMCVSCRERKNKSELVRVVLLPDGTIEVDPTGKMAGRGAYVCKSKECLDAAIKAQRIEKSLNGKADDMITERISEMIGRESDRIGDPESGSGTGEEKTNRNGKPSSEEKILSFLGLANKAGQVVSGADAVSAASGKNTVFLFIASEDAAQGTVRLLTRISADKGIPLYRFSTKSRLGSKLGKRDRAAIAVTDKNFSTRLAELLNEHILNK